MKCPYCGSEEDYRDQQWSAADRRINILCTSCGNCIQSFRPSEPAPEAGSSGSIASEGVTPPLADKETNPYQQQREPLSGGKVGKYFLHGLAFSLLMFAIALGWSFALLFLVMVGSLIGLIIGFVVLAYLTGWLNAFLLQIILGINDGGKWKKLVANGFILLMLLFVVSIPQLFLTWLFPGVVTSIVLFVPYCFVDGYVARKMVDSPC